MLFFHWPSSSSYPVSHSIQHLTTAPSNNAYVDHMIAEIETHQILIGQLTYRHLKTDLEGDKIRGILHFIIIELVLTQLSQRRCRNDKAWHCCKRKYRLDKNMW